jgi:hypothetical protein
MDEHDPAPTRRLTVGAVLRDFVDEFVSTDRGFAHTLIGLLRDPGATSRRWIEQRDPRLTRPARFLMIVLGPLVVLISLTQWGAWQYAEMERTLPPGLVAEGGILDLVLRWRWSSISCSCRCSPSARASPSGAAG